MSTPSTAIATANSERQFIETYTQLMGLSENTSPSQFYSTHDYDKLQSLGPSLPKFSYKFPTTVSAKADEGSSIKLKFKSIKPPFKITHEFDAPTTSTVYKIKSQLIEDVDTLKSAGVSPKDVKLMLKSKVVQDTSTLTSLVAENSELSFNCIITPPPASKEPEVEAPTSLSDSAFKQIYNIIKQDLSDPSKADEIFQKFKNSI
ncbi:hypothetical protein KGF57_003051 [Candida theae]|uniref:Ubiquitin-like domain-containing protein n=1 Tax=Candida theae TaxID=1198502 RepID=A0AAD5BDW4_9ASCO|nr:uncharacterized protein KGF57_003051 [Candida theae]KAI5957784.1 hypothetical protein KGF57_003051 [Candida theae]